MRYYLMAVIGIALSVGPVLVAPRRALAAPLVLAQAEGGGIGGSIGGSLESPGARTVQARPRVRRAVVPRAAPAPRAAQAPRVVIERRVVYQPRTVERRSAGRGDAAGFDGVWSVSSGGGCSTAGTSQVMISGGRVMGQTGVSGHVSPAGAVSTLGSYNGVTVVGQGQISGRSASGLYRQSDGCAGTWSAVKL